MYFVWWSWQVALLVKNQRRVYYIYGSYIYGIITALRLCICKCVCLFVYLFCVCLWILDISSLPSFSSKLVLVTETVKASFNLKASLKGNCLFCFVCICTFLFVYVLKHSKDADTPAEFNSQHQYLWNFQSPRAKNLCLCIYIV